jgi:hypothetical protein
MKQTAFPSQDKLVNKVREVCSENRTKPKLYGRNLYLSEAVYVYLPPSFKESAKQKK